MVCIYWNCPSLFKVSFYKHCRANPISPIYKPTTIPWSIFHLLIYKQHDNNMIWIQHRWGIYQDSGIGHIITRQTGIPLFRIREIISHILRFGIAVFLCSRIQYVKFIKFGITGACLNIIWTCFYVCNWCSVCALCTICV